MGYVQFGSVLSFSKGNMRPRCDQNNKNNLEVVSQNSSSEYLLEVASIHLEMNFKSE
jgi:hypothetical protein